MYIYNSNFQQISASQNAIIMHVCIIINFYMKGTFKYVYFCTYMELFEFNLFATTVYNM